MINFYEQIEGFTKFQNFTDTKVYSEAPDSWFVILTDVKGSTKAIQDGRYREVNTLGAASIAVVQSEMKGEQVPYVFGGDGATFLVPPYKVEEVKTSLRKLMQHSIQQFGFELRVGIVEVSKVHEAGQKILVGKFRFNNFGAIAIIKGGGLNWAEKKIKSDPSLCLQPFTELFAVPSKLSCRWQAIKSKNGVVLSILIQPRNGDVDSVRSLTSQLEEICDGDFENANPVSISSLKYKGFFRMLIDELNLHQKKVSKEFFNRVFEMVLSWWAFKLKLPAPFRAKAYKNELNTHSDYRKYDDVLRLVLDCSRSQAEKIRAALSRSFENKEIYFGIHESSHSLMTCLVESLQPGGHIHFIDGSSGGYAMAAQQMKSQF